MENRGWLFWLLLAALVVVLAVTGLSLVRINSLNQETASLRARNVRLSQELP